MHRPSFVASRVSFAPLAAFALALLTSATPAVASSLPPDNDNRASATVVAALPYHASVDTSAATTEAVDPGFGMVGTIWYRFTPSATASYRVNATIDSGFALTVVTAGDELVSAFYGYNDVFLSEGVTYTFCVGTQGTQVPAITFSITSPPANDEPDQAFTIGALPFSVAADSSDATASFDDPQIDGRDLQATTWWIYRPARRVRVQVTPTLAFPGTVGAVYGASGDFTVIAWSDGAPFTVDLFPDVDYRFFVAGDAAGGAFSFTLREVASAAPPPNDRIANATRLTLGDITAVPVPLSLGTVSSDDPLATDTASSLWYKIVPSADTLGAFAVVGGNHAIGVIFTGAPGGLTVYSGFLGMNFVSLKKGVTYWLAMLTQRGQHVADTTLYFGRWAVTAPNDDFANAKLVEQGVTDSYDTSQAMGAFDDPVIPLPAGSAPLGATVWYKLRPPRAARLDLFSHDAGVAFGVYSGSRGRLAKVGYSGNAIGAVEPVTLQANVTYYVMVAMPNAFGPTSFDVNIGLTPDNDLFTNPTPVGAPYESGELDLRFATRDLGVPACQGRDQLRLWYSVTFAQSTCFHAYGDGGTVDLYRPGATPAPIACGGADDEVVAFARAGRPTLIGVGTGDASPMAFMVEAFDGGGDGDGDGVPDGCDVCNGLWDPDQADADQDRLGDACDLCVNDPTSVSADSDSDGVGDACDNCAARFNDGQDDGDGDGVGDACDDCLVTPNNDQTDADGDGIGNLCDVCWRDQDPAQADADRDGRGDVCDRCPALDGELAGGWVRGGELLAGRSKATAAVLAGGPFAGQVMVVGGTTGTGTIDGTSYTRLDTSELYNPESETWRPGPRLPASYIGAAAVALSGRRAGEVLLIGNGYFGGRSFVVVAITNELPPRRISARTGLVSPVAKPPFDLIVEPMAVRLADGKVLVHGLALQPGDTSAQFRGYLYDPAADKWTAEPFLDALLGEPFEGMMVRLDDGRVVMIDESQPEPVIYDPAARTAEIGPAAPVYMPDTAIAALPGNRVLVTGGRTTEGLTLIFDVDAGTWSTVEPLPDTRRTDAVGVTLSDGRAFVIGGFTVGGEDPVQNAMSSTWTFEPEGDEDGDGALDDEDACPCSLAASFTSVEASPAVLTPADGRMVSVAVAPHIAAGCDASCHVVDVWQNECGGGQVRCSSTALGEAQVTGGGVRLRAASSATTPRRYTVIVECDDGSEDPVRLSTAITVRR